LEVQLHLMKKERMKKIFLLTLLFLNGCNFISDEIIPARPIISIEKNAAIIQNTKKPFQLTDEYYEIFKVLKINDTVLVEDLFNSNAIVPKNSVFRPLFNPKILLQLAKQMMLTEHEDIDCIKSKLIGFANSFVGAALAGGGVAIPCNTKSSELAALVALLDIRYTKVFEYEPIENILPEAKVVLRQKAKPIKPTPIPCPAGVNDFRRDMNIDFLNTTLGGNGESANFTLVEQGYLDVSAINLTFPFGFSNNSRLHNQIYYKNIALSIPVPLPSRTHIQKDVSVLFDDPFTLGSTVNGISKNTIINKVYFFDNNCMLNMIYAEYEALLEAIVETPTKGVLLLEFGAGSNNYYPAEKEPVLFRLIQFASMYKNIIIIEPAGNGGIDVAAAGYTPKYNPETICTNNENNDSGAIMVGGAEAFDTRGPGTSTYRKVVNKPKCGVGSNFGDRINCYAQGEYIKTNYPGDHHSSSAASAIIAGLAVDIQSIAITRGRYLTPSEMRFLLSRPSSIKVKQGGRLDDKYIPVINEAFLSVLDNLLAPRTR
jgi:hypothetical protein